MATNQLLALPPGPEIPPKGHPRFLMPIVAVGGYFVGPRSTLVAENSAPLNGL